MKDYLNKKVKIYEKAYHIYSTNKFNSSIYQGVITNIIDERFIELDNKVLISINFIYMIEIVD